MNENSRFVKAYENVRLVVQGVFILPFLPLLFLLMAVLDWSDKKIPSPPGTSKLRSCLFWLLFILVCSACWGYFGGWLLFKIYPR